MRERKRRGLAYVPADRQRVGLVLPFPVSDNLVLTRYCGSAIRPQWDRRSRGDPDRCADLIEKYDIRTPSASVPVSTLSGGNQQKIVVAREFSGDIQLLLLDQPTRGLDVGSIEFIHHQIIAMRDAGAAVLLVSAELDEVLELADRIGVIYRGRLVEVMASAEATRERVGLLMATGEAQPKSVDAAHHGRRVNVEALPPPGEREAPDGPAPLEPQQSTHPSSRRSPPCCWR